MDPDQLPNLPNPFVTVAVAIVITFAALFGYYVYEGQVDFLAKAKKRNDMHGTMNLAWIKLTPAVVETFCKDDNVATCSTFDEKTNTCYILSPDKKGLLTDIGYEFMSCVRDKKQSDVLIPLNVTPVAMKYWFTKPWIIDDVCKTGDSNACVISTQNLIVAPLPRREVEYTTVGHEIKHLFDGWWHDQKGYTYTDAFQHDKYEPTAGTIGVRG